MQYTWWTKYTINIYNCFWSHPKGLWRVKWPCSCTVVCALAMVASLEIKTLNKATRKQGLCSSKRVLYQCRLTRSVEEVLTWHHHKNQLCQIHLIPHQPVVPAGLPRWCAYMTSFRHVVGLQWMHVYNECMNFVNNIAHRILLHCQQKGWANGFLPKCLFCGALAASDYN